MVKYEGTSGKSYIANELLTGEAQFSRQHGDTCALYLRINPKTWETLLNETPYATYINKEAMLFYNSKIVLDDQCESWEFSHELPGRLQ